MLPLTENKEQLFCSAKNISASRRRLFLTRLRLNSPSWASPVPRLSAALRSQTTAECARRSRTRVTGAGTDRWQLVGSLPLGSHGPAEGRGKPTRVNHRQVGDLRPGTSAPCSRRELQNPSRRYLPRCSCSETTSSSSSLPPSSMCTSPQLQAMC